MSALDHKANAEALDIALYGKPDIYTPPEAYKPRRASIAEKLAELYPGPTAVDQKAEALAALSGPAQTIWPEAPSVDVAIAQVHATLALVEQQRIANLIAFLGAEGGPYKYINDMDGAHEKALDEIREGLGLS